MLATGSAEFLGSRLCERLIEFLGDRQVADLGLAE